MHFAGLSINFICVTISNNHRKFGYHLHKNFKICAYAAEGGYIEVLSWLKDSGCILNSCTYSWAVCRGNLETVKWLRENGCPWDSTICSWASSGGQLELLKWLRNNGCPWTQDTIVSAINNRHFDIVDWARQNECPCSVVLDTFLRKKEYLKHYIQIEIFDTESED